MSTQKKGNTATRNESYDSAGGFTTSDGGNRISMQGSKKADKVSNFAIFVACLIFGLSSTALTFVNKTTMTAYKDELSPMNIIMVQSLFSVLISLVFMTIKEARISTFVSLRNYGVVIPEFSKMSEKFTFGLPLGLFGVMTLVPTLYALKYSTLPLFIVNRRGTMLTSFAAGYLVNGEKPTSSLVGPAIILNIGALIASLYYEKSSADVVGLILVWVANIAQSLQHILATKFNSNNYVTPFEVNFFFALVGLTTSAIYNFLLTENYAELAALLADPTISQKLLPMLTASAILNSVLSLSFLSLVMIGGPMAVQFISTAKEALLTYEGMVLFQDGNMTDFDSEKWNNFVLLGLALGLAGTAWSLKVRFRLWKQEKQSKKSLDKKND